MTTAVKNESEKDTWENRQQETWKYENWKQGGTFKNGYSWGRRENENKEIQEKYMNDDNERTTSEYRETDAGEILQ